MIAYFLLINCRKCAYLAYSRHKDNDKFDIITKKLFFCFNKMLYLLKMSMIYINGDLVNFIQ